MILYCSCVGDLLLQEIFGVCLVDACPHVGAPHKEGLEDSIEDA